MPHRASRAQRRRTPPLRTDCERLEPRRCLAAAAGGTGRIAWNGEHVNARCGAWVVRTERPLAAADLAGGLGWRTTSLGEGCALLVAPGVSADVMAAWAGRTPAVVSIEPDVALAPLAIPNDASFDTLWGLTTSGPSRVGDSDINAPEAWDITTGSRNVVVAVIDSGIDYTHPDLAANVWTNPREVAGDGIDNDANGFIDDVRGWDFANADADPMDDDGHGTHVSGTIGAVGNNAIGVTGVNWQISIMGLKFLDAKGNGYTSNAVAAVTYATRMRRDFGVNVVAINASWGSEKRSVALRDAIASAGRAGILFVTAAGNESSNNDRVASYPANDASDAVIAVTATNRSNRLAAFSNYGSTTVDLAAPGVAILSTVPGGGYAASSGTSMATPYVTGTVALMAAANPRATAAEIRAAILSTARPVAALAGKVATGGLLDAAAAVRAITQPAPTPTTERAVTTLRRDAGDTLRRAQPVTATTGSVTLASRIGDGPRGRRDVDLFRVNLAAGQRLTIDVATQSLASTSTLECSLRLFDSKGGDLTATNDAFGAPAGMLSFTAPKGGVYYVGVSGSGNTGYKPSRAGSGRNGSTGTYQIEFTFDP
ncbi:MAG: S8 family serine peptidase [Planctomycetes bacterium]|nr:S8 family serine peptidase [Planctomycetota bacterium]